MFALLGGLMPGGLLKQAGRIGEDPGEFYSNPRNWYGTAVGQKPRFASKQQSQPTSAMSNYRLGTAPSPPQSTGDPIQDVMLGRASQRQWSSF